MPDDFEKAMIGRLAHIVSILAKHRADEATNSRSQQRWLKRAEDARKTADFLDPATDHGQPLIREAPEKL